MDLDAFDVNTRLIICFLVGNRTPDVCRMFLKNLSRRIVNKPLFVSDELPHYKDAILETYRTVKTFEKTDK